MKKTAPLFAFLSVSAIVCACSSTGGSGPSTTNPPGPNTATLHAGSFVVPQALADVATVQPDRIVFPASAASQLPQYVAGNILLSDRASGGGTAGNPNGFLRKVVSVSTGASGITIMTSQAVLQEAFDELTFHSTVQVPESAQTGPVAQASALHPLGGGSTTVKLLDYSGFKLLNETQMVTLPGGKVVTFNEFATVTTGTLNFVPSYNISASLNGLSVSTFQATATGTLAANLVLDAGVSVTPPLTSLTFSEVLAQSVPQTVSKPVASNNASLGSVSAGPVTMPVSVQYTATLACQFTWGGAEEVTIGGSATGSVSAGLTYANESLAPTFSDSLSFTHTGPNYKLGGVVQAFCSITPKFELQLFGIATVDLTVNAYAGIGGDLTCGGAQVNEAGLFKAEGGAGEGKVQGQLIAGASAVIDAQVNILGLFKYNKSCVLFNEYDNQTYGDTFPLPAFPDGVATCTASSKYHPIPVPAVNGTACFGSTVGGDAGPVGLGTNVGDSGTTTHADASKPAKDSGTTSHKDSGTTSHDSGQTFDATTPGDSAVPNIADAAWDGYFEAADTDAVVTNEAGIIEGSCTHDVCTAGDRLGQQCNQCTLTICKTDPYCCDTYWGASCFVDVQNLCGETCPP